VADGGISGLAVAFAAAGGLLVYAGLKNLSPAAALRDVSTGRPSPVPDIGVELSGAAAGAAVGGLPVGAGGAAAAAGGAVAAAATKYMADRYSQLRRTRPGWSDCSSFADKVLTDVGIRPPTKWASTANYRASPEWVTIAREQARPGDIAVSGGHMVLVTGNGGSSAIGQQNPRVNVRTGTVAQLMGSQTYVYKRYTPKG